MEITKGTERGPKTELERWPTEKEAGKAIEYSEALVSEGCDPHELSARWM